MIAVLGALALAVPISLAGQDPQVVEEVRTLARTGSDSALTRRVRAQPTEAREALRLLLAGAASAASDSAQAARLTDAKRIAGAIAVAWSDSFPVRQVERFRSLSVPDRRATVAADSIWRAGRAAIASEGMAVAMRILRDALHRFEALADTSGMAASLNGLGVGYTKIQEYDSALTYLNRGRDYAERMGDLRTGGGVLANLGNVRWRQGDLPAASDLFTRAREIFERIGESAGVRGTYSSFGLVAWSGGDLATARTAFEKGLSLSRRAKDTTRIELFLSNLGGVVAEQGDYAAATPIMEEAVTINRQQESWLDLAQALRNLAVIKQRRGDFPGAEADISEALETMRRMGPGAAALGADEIDMLSVLSTTRAHMGDLQGARAALERAEVFARRGGAETRASLVELALAWGDLELRLNRLSQAERQYARAARLAYGEAADQKRSEAQIGLAAVLFKRQRYQLAQATLQQALAKRSLDIHLTALMRLLLGEAAARGGDTATARRAFRQVLDTVRALGAAADEAQALGRLGDLEAGAGRALAAESLYQSGLRRLRARPEPSVAWQLHAALAGSLRQRRALDDAVRELHAGIDQIERMSGTLQLEEQRSAFRADKWGVYVDLAMIEQARGRTAAALEASERLRARQMLDLLARGRVGDRQQHQQLSMQEQDLRRRIGELSTQTDSLAPGDAGPQATRDPPSEAVPAAAGEELSRLQKEYAELMLQIREADPSYASMVRGEIVPARTVMAGLAPDEALLEYLVGDSSAIVFVATADTLAAFDLGIDHDALAAQVDFARSALASGARGATRQAWRPALRRLYQQLVAPAEASGLLAGKRRLIVAPHAELHYLPFAALVQPGQPDRLLIERYLIEYVPSASVWLRLRDRPRPAPSGGVLALAPRAKVLPGSRSEVAAIKRIYGERAQTMVGSSATEPAFRSLASNREIIHLATYGVLNKHNPLFSYVELGKAPGEDGRLEVHEVFGLSLNARLLVLSACQTGLAAGELADVPPGDDWVGLVQGFLYAGASNVMATLWPVADVATARLMERFYKELSTDRREVEALALTQRAALADPATAHPFFWAGFTLVRGR